MFYSYCTVLGFNSCPPLAKVGTVLPGGFKIKPAVIRGEKSYGMLCAEDELGISDDHSGIMILKDDAKVGKELSEYFERYGFNLDIDLTPNRPDCASHIGVARDLSVLTGNVLKIPDVKIDESNSPVENDIEIEIINKQGCPRYAARVVKGVKIGPSPEWLVNYMQSIGGRSINNVVDAANYVLMETGHPLHTFDLNYIEGRKIIVRSAQDGELVQTLDEEERELSRDVLLICDAKKPVAIAGIMGLLNSEISDDTTDILIESAYFDPPTIRRGSKYLGLSTEASYRFERGADHEGVIYAVNRVTQLIKELAGGEISKGILDCYPRKIEPVRVKIRFQRIDDLLGINVNREWIQKIFRRLGCDILNVDDVSIELISPTWRPDLVREVDYIEEVVRVYGMEKIPISKRISIHPAREYNPEYKFIEKVRSNLCGYGFYELYCNSLVHERHTHFTFSDIKPVKISNPLSRDMTFLRTSLIPGILNSVKQNINRRNFDLKLFELGYIQAVEIKSVTTAREMLRAAVVVTGNLEEQHWNQTTRVSDIFILKGVLEDLIRRFNVGNVLYKNYKHRYFGNIVKTEINGKPLAHFGELDIEYLNKEWSIEVPVFAMEVDLEMLFKASNFEFQYTPLPAFPAIKRDISLTVNLETTVDTVKRKIVDKGGKLLKEVKFYDLYKGKNIDKELKSLTFNLVFQDSSRTLTDEEIDSLMSKIHKSLIKDLNAKLR